MEVVIGITSISQVEKAFGLVVHVTVINHNRVAFWQQLLHLLSFIPLLHFAKGASDKSDMLLL